MKHLYMVLEKNKIQTLLEIHFENIFIQFLDLFRPTSIDPINGSLGHGELGLNQIMGLINKK